MLIKEIFCSEFRRFQCALVVPLEISTARVVGNFLAFQYQLLDLTFRCRKGGLIVQYFCDDERAENAYYSRG
ncbi:hypothetical protein A6P55_16080 [Pandoraea pnomenusa]|nr:hypothetical protein A6P55_16080 [Pandoraea pnomenusa]